MQSGPKSSAIFSRRTGYSRRISPTSVSVRIGRDLLLSPLPFEDRLRPPPPPGSVPPEFLSTSRTRHRITLLPPLHESSFIPISFTNGNRFTRSLTNSSSYVFISPPKCSPS